MLRALSGYSSLLACGALEVDLVRKMAKTIDLSSTSIGDRRKAKYLSSQIKELSSNIITTLKIINQKSGVN